jgi:hypothetical protein
MNTKTNSEDFIREIDARRIEYLVHFTRFENITAIIGDRKILPRKELHNVSFEWKELITLNSETRYDDESFLNTSIMRPNLYLLRIFQSRIANVKFCIIGINPKYIYESNTKFSITNATYRPAREFGINGNLATFNAMFNSTIDGRPNRQTGGTYRKTRSPDLRSFYPTDEEAEVLINCEIPYEDILFIATKNTYEYNILISAFDVLDLPKEKIYVEPAFFLPK